ncbi:MAG: FHA domain-containing protein [Muribaculaceae bacterium]|nr:FHA domain-containing protein [Muribaculaceae bacterium]
MKTLSIGRSSSCDIIIENQGISRHHADISIVGGQYVFTDHSSNGSTIGGMVIKNQRITVAPGAEIYLANSVPFPWAQVFIQLPIAGNKVYEPNTSNYNISPSEPRKEEELNIAIAIVSFIIPLVGIILYFAWKGDTPKRANQVIMCAVAGFVLNLILFSL